ncbi:MAG: gamma-glutamylcyclotransferase family protein [Ilumatobacter sp.]|uniref:gamma-glutamylcyclotransferase family protein n=1 Tax=Ilumatobacter sp. TaxID=1967498 RepID=UPI003919E380
MTAAWVFGYGSLVSPASMATTIGRPVAAPDVRIADLAGFGRRWNYGSMHLRGSWSHAGVDIVDGLVVSLGLAAADTESCNGVIVRVDGDELAALDWRERDYERTDVSDRIRVLDGEAMSEPVVTYVPRPSAIERYERGRDEGRAAVRRSYWDLVHDAFAALGGDHAARLSATPQPDIPVVDITLAR